jgi:hypothetical protein
MYGAFIEDLKIRVPTKVSKIGYQKPNRPFKLGFLA